MNGDKDGVALAIGNGTTFIKADELVVETSQDCTVAERVEARLEATGDIEGVDFFGVAVAGDAAPIVSAVSRIDDHGGAGESGGSGEIE